METARVRQGQKERTVKEWRVQTMASEETPLAWRQCQMRNIERVPRISGALSQACSRGRVLWCLPCGSAQKTPARKSSVMWRGEVGNYFRLLLRHRYSQSKAFCSFRTACHESIHMYFRLVGDVVLLWPYDPHQSTCMYLDGMEYFYAFSFINLGMHILDMILIFNQINRYLELIVQVFESIPQ